MAFGKAANCQSLVWPVEQVPVCSGKTSKGTWMPITREVSCNPLSRPAHQLLHQGDFTSMISVPLPQFLHNSKPNSSTILTAHRAIQANKSPNRVRSSTYAVSRTILLGAHVSQGTYLTYVCFKVGRRRSRAFGAAAESFPSQFLTFTSSHIAHKLARQFQLPFNIPPPDHESPSPAIPPLSMRCL